MNHTTSGVLTDIRLTFLSFLRCFHFLWLSLEDTSEKSLTKVKTRSGGRNNDGRMTMRYLGGGHKKKYRIIDFKRDKFGIPAVVKSIEYHKK